MGEARPASLTHHADAVGVVGQEPRIVVCREIDPYEGILTQVAFTALHSPAGRSSATIRGKALREVMLCQDVPMPPGNVDFTLFESGKDRSR